MVSHRGSVYATPARGTVTSKSSSRVGSIQTWDEGPKGGDGWMDDRTGLDRVRDPSILDRIESIDHHLVCPSPASPDRVSIPAVAGHREASTLGTRVRVPPCGREILSAATAIIPGRTPNPSSAPRDPRQPPSNHARSGHPGTVSASTFLFPSLVPPTAAIVRTYWADPDVTRRASCALTTAASARAFPVTAVTCIDLPKGQRCSLCGVCTLQSAAEPRASHSPRPIPASQLPHLADDGRSLSSPRTRSPTPCPAMSVA
jgi:hypothetical protein